MITGRADTQKKRDQEHFSMERLKVERVSMHSLFLRREENKITDGGEKGTATKRSN